MVINRIVLDGVEYAITDKEAQLVAAILSNRVDGVETTTARLDTDVAEIRAELEKIREDISNLDWYWQDVK